MADKKIKKQDDFEMEKGNLEIVSKDEERGLASSSPEGGSVSISKDGIDVKRGGNIIIGSLNIMAGPFKKRNREFYQGNKFHLIADIVLLAVIVILALSFLVIRNWKPKSDMVIEVFAHEKIITSGQAESFEIRYKNNNKEKITNANLTLTLPRKFILLEALPKDIFNSNTNTFKIGDLEPGENGRVEITGIVLGEINERQMISLSMDYFHNGAKSIALNSLIYSVEESIIDLSVYLPEEIYRDADFSGKIIIKNNSEFEIEDDIEISFVDSQLRIKSIDLSSGSLNNNIIGFSGLESKKILEISFEAETAFSGNILPVKIETYLNSQRGRIKQQEKEERIIIISPKFRAFLETDERTAEEGERVNFKLSYENNEEAEIRDLRFEIRPESSAFAVSDLKMISDGKYEIAGNVIRLSENLPAGSRGILQFEAVFGKKKIGTELGTSLTAIIGYKIGEKSVSYKIFSPRLKFVSDLSVSSSGRYYSQQGDQLGVGPLPPTVDVPTSYWIFWEADNFGNNLENLLVSADLGENVAWTGNKSLTAGKMQYGAIGGRIIWNVDELSKEGEKYRAGFEIKLIPSLAQKGKVVDLVKNIKYSAYDSFAEKEIEGELKNITTDLPDDQIAGGKGRVVEMDLIN